MEKLSQQFNNTVVRSYHDVLLLEETKRKYSRTTTSFRGRNAMEWLYKNGPQKISDLADFLRISRPSVTTLIKKLEALGYISRMPDGEDGRSEKINLTRKGQLVTAYQTHHREKVIEEVMGEFSDSELEIIMRGFSRMNEVFENCVEVLEDSKK